MFICIRMKAANWSEKQEIIPPNFICRRYLVGGIDLLGNTLVIGVIDPMHLETSPALHTYIVLTKVRGLGKKFKI